MKKLLLSLFFVLNITFGCFGAEEEKVDGTVYTLVSQEYRTETPEVKIANGFRVTREQLQTLSLGLPLTMIEEAEENDNNTIDLPQVQQEILRFILSLEPHINYDGTPNTGHINTAIDALLSLHEASNRLEVISEFIIALIYLNSQTIIEIFIDKFVENAYTFNGNVLEGSSLHAISLLQQTCDNRVQNRMSSELFPFLATKTSTTRLPIPAYAHKLKLNPQKPQIAIAQENNIVVYNTTTGEILNTLEGHLDLVNEIEWNNRGTQLASSSNDRTIKIWDTDTGTCLKTLTEHTSKIYNVCWNPQGTKLALTTRDGKIKIWDLITGSSIETKSSKFSNLLELNFKTLYLEFISYLKDNFF